MAKFIIELEIPDSSLAAGVLKKLSKSELADLLLRAAERHAKQKKTGRDGQKLVQRPRVTLHDDCTLPPVEGFAGYDDSSPTFDR